MIFLQRKMSISASLKRMFMHFYRRTIVPNDNFILASFIVDFVVRYR